MNLDEYLSKFKVQHNHLKTLYKQISGIPLLKYLFQQIWGGSKGFSFQYVVQILLVLKQCVEKHGSEFDNRIYALYAAIGQLDELRLFLLSPLLSLSSDCANLLWQGIQCFFSLASGSIKRGNKDYFRALMKN